MNIIMKFETRELKCIYDLTYYNYICYKLKIPILGITHIYEKYDNMTEYVFYELGYFVNDEFICYLTGEGDKIPEGKDNTGGVYVEIEIHYPDLSLEILK
jgi:hypothetical protein